MEKKNVLGAERSEVSCINGYFAQDFGKVAVLLGGSSAEREVSLETGKNALAALLSFGIEAQAIDPLDGFIYPLMQGGFSRVFIALHGTFGEDGVIQGMLEGLKLPYTGSNVSASSLAMDKIRSKYIFQAMGICTPDFRVVDSFDAVLSVVKEFNLPVVIKPSMQGSSVGVSIVKSSADLMAAYNKASEYGQVLVEPCIQGREYTVGILGQKILPSIQIAADEIFYDYHAKYKAENTKYLFDTLTQEKEDEIGALALRAYQALGCSNYGRVDLMQDDRTGKFYVLEVNTLPGMTSHSLVPKAAAKAGIDFNSLILNILSATMNSTINEENKEVLS